MQSENIIDEIFSAVEEHTEDFSFDAKDLEVSVYEKPETFETVVFISATVDGELYTNKSTFELHDATMVDLDNIALIVLCDLEEELAGERPLHYLLH